MRITYDRERDVAYFELDDVRKPHPEGGSNMLLPPWFPFRVDVFYDGAKGEEYLVAVRVEDASKRLHPDALAQAVPFEPYAS